MNPFLVKIKRMARRWYCTRNTIRYRVELRAIFELLAGHSVSAGVLLDVGAGGGEMSLRLAEAGYAHRLIGIEPFEGNFKELRNTYSVFPGATAIQASIERIPLDDGKCDIVMCTQVLEHIADDAAAVAELARVVKPGGFLIIGVPFIPEGYTPEQCCHYDPSGHLRPGYTPEQLSALFAPHGCELIQSASCITEKTCRRLVMAERLGLFRVLTPAAWVDAERRMSDNERQHNYPMGIVCLLRKRGI